MKYIYDNDLHIHSKISLCSDDEAQTTDRILEYAIKNNLKTICVADHFWDKEVPGASEWYSQQDFQRICASKPLPQAEGIRFLFGCETELDKDLTLGISLERFEEFDFVVIPATHFHMPGFTLSEEEESLEGRVKAWVKHVEGVLDMPLPFHKVGLAHLALDSLGGGTREAYLQALDMLKAEDMERIFTKAARLGCGIELNAFDMMFSDEESDSVLRMYRIAKQCGCKFYCASDAHHPNELDGAKEVLERAIDLLGLTEEDKFHVL